MNKKQLSERDICTKFITPALRQAGWDEMTQLREEVGFTKGRILVRGKLVTRGRYWRIFKSPVDDAMRVAMFYGSREGHHSVTGHARRRRDVDSQTLRSGIVAVRVAHACRSTSPLAASRTDHLVGM